MPHRSAVLELSTKERLTRAANYDKLAGLYDVLGALYSGGAIERSKKIHLTSLRPGDTVLYAGAGTGVECAEAARTGAKITVCDASRRMLLRAQKRFEEQELLGHFEQGDALALSGAYDLVVAPYFLNVFDRREVGPALAALAARVKPGGRLLTVDFHAPTGRLPFRLLQRLYYLAPQLLFLLLARNPWHELYDYPTIARRVAPDLELQERIGTKTFGLPLYETVIWEKPR